MKPSKLLFWGVLLILFWSCSDFGDLLQVPEIEVSTSLNFDSVALGDSAEATLQISNDGTLALILDSLRITGIDLADFQITSQIADGTEIAPKGDLDVVIQFKPSSHDDKTAALNIFSNDPNNLLLNVSFTVGDVLVSYENQIQPIFDTNCTICHGGSGGLDLSEDVSYNKLYDVDAQNYSGKRVKPYDAANSILWNKIANTGTYGGAMPQGSSSLNADEAQLIETWINEGAQDN